MPQPSQPRSFLLAAAAAAAGSGGHEATDLETSHSHLNTEDEDQATEQFYQMIDELQAAHDTLKGAPNRASLLYSCYGEAHVYLQEVAQEILKVDTLDQLSGRANIRPLLEKLEHAESGGTTAAEKPRVDLPRIYFLLANISKSPFYEETPFVYTQLIALYLHPNFTRLLASDQRYVLLGTYSLVLQALVCQQEILEKQTQTSAGQLASFNVFAACVLNSLEGKIEHYFKMIHKVQAPELSELASLYPTHWQSNPEINWQAFLEGTEYSKTPLYESRDKFDGLAVIDGAKRIPPESESRCELGHSAVTDYRAGQDLFLPYLKARNGAPVSPSPARSDVALKDRP